MPPAPEQTMPLPYAAVAVTLPPMAPATPAAGAGTDPGPGNSGTGNPGTGNPGTGDPGADLDTGQAGPPIPAGLALLGPPAGLATPGVKARLVRPEMTGILGHNWHKTVSGALSPFADVARDPRLFRWTGRLVACTAVGATLAILVNWQLGLVVAVLVAIIDGLYYTRTSAAIPPAARASSAQRRTRRRLARLGPAGYLSLHARAIPGTGSVIDHLVVGPAGIYAVDSEVWDRRLPVRATRGGGLFHGPADQAARLEHARWEAAEASRLISTAIGQPIAVQPAMVIYGPTVPWIMIKIRGVDVFCGNRLRKYLRREASANRARRLNHRQTEALHAIAAQVLPPTR
jgi:Nuclease-related domain